MDTLVSGYSENVQTKETGATKSECDSAITSLQQNLQCYFLQDSTNCKHGEECACNMHIKMFLHACKSMKTPLSSTWMLFKVVSCFCVWKQIFSITRHS